MGTRSKHKRDRKVEISPSEPKSVYGWGFAAFVTRFRGVKPIRKHGHFNTATHMANGKEIA